LLLRRATWHETLLHRFLYVIDFKRALSFGEGQPRGPEPAKRWLAFLRNHREAIAAMDFFTVPTLNFSVLYFFFIIGHDLRRILHFNVTRHPTSAWVIQQLRETFPYDSAAQFLIFDRDAKYGTEVPAALRSMKIRAVRTSRESPWQNGIAERWVGSCRRDLLDHVIAVNERHLKRLLTNYVTYYHEDRTHLGRNKGTPHARVPAVARGRVVADPRLGGLHHRYDRGLGKRRRAENCPLGFNWRGASPGLRTCRGGCEYREDRL
jgi:putative transposase